MARDVSDANRALTWLCVEKERRALQRREHELGEGTELIETHSRVLRMILEWCHPVACFVWDPLLLVEVMCGGWRLVEG